MILTVEIYTNAKTRHPGRNSLSPATDESLRRFENAIAEPNYDDDDTLQDISVVGRPRGSMASVLDMMSLTLAVMPASSKNRGPIPLRTFLFGFSSFSHLPHFQRRKASTTSLPLSEQLERTLTRRLISHHCHSQTTRRRWPGSFMPLNWSHLRLLFGFQTTRLTWPGRKQSICRNIMICK